MATAPNQAYQITSPGTLTLTELGLLPKPGPNEILVRIAAFSLNYRDKLVIDHSPAYPIVAVPNLIPGSDGAGTVHSAGSSSTWKAGDRVIVHPNTWLYGNDDREFKFDQTMGGGPTDGTFRRWMLLRDERVARAPDGLSLEEAATVFTAGVTAYRALFYNCTGPVKEGMTVLTQGTGGVSAYAMMIAAAAGATVIATSSSDNKLEVARQLGAKHLVNYAKNPDWAAEVLKVTDGKGADLVVDVVGAQTMEQTMKATAFKGTIVVLGMLSDDPLKPVNIMNDVLFKAITITGQLGAGSHEILEATSAFLEKHQLHPPIAATFDFEDAEKAVKELEKLSKPGKIVVKG